MPRTLLARTFLLLAMLVLLTTAGWLSLFSHIDAEPRARETAQLAASAVNLIRASLFAAAPAKRLGLFNEFSRREGIRLLPAEPEDKIEAMPDSRFFRLLQRELTARLGDHTRIAASVDGVPGLRAATAESSWDTLPTGVSPTCVTTSPGRIPAWAAGPFCSTPVMITPVPGGTEKLSASSGVRSWGSTPIQPRVTLPSRTMASITLRAVDVGMAKPMPMEPPERE